MKTSIYSKIIKKEERAIKEHGIFHIVARSIFMQDGKVFHAETHCEPRENLSITELWNEAKSLLYEKYNDIYLNHSVTIRRPNGRRIVFTR